MTDVLIKTMYTFLLAFAISMFTALLIYLIKVILTSPYFNSLFDKEAKKEAIRMRRIHFIHKQKMKFIMKKVQLELHDDLNDFHYGIKDKKNSEELEK